MKRGTKCVVQTINLSNPKTCVRPKVQRIVSTDADSFPNPNRASDYRTSRPVAIKVGSWKDEHGKCPPKVREGYQSCQSLGRVYYIPLNYLYVVFIHAQYREPSQEESSPPLSTNAILGRAAAFFIKGAIIAGLICWTYTEGLWGDSSKTEDLYHRMTSVIFPDRPVSIN
ncbi:uncharacterized protein LOC105203646 [Solenopsis invicta]|uniref:uncharacterized protein LOC105203646 n=1 Tax=Solenopsis invicta TaxID=13686 RepID=UPI00193EACC3|nr:uncharacterized protein LOC105203646 [Solenopsis invicta]